MIEALLDPRQDWYDGELSIITGFHEEEYRALRRRLGAPGYHPTQDDDQMVNQAAVTLVGYPATSEAASREVLGHDWLRLLKMFLKWETEDGNSEAE